MALDLVAEKGMKPRDCFFFIWETCGNTVAQRVQFGTAWSEDESVLLSVSRENDVCNCALHVIGLYGSGDKVSLSLPGGLGACEGGVKLSLPCCARKCTKLGSWAVAAKAVTAKEMW